jgi:putative membrane protein
MKHLYLLIIIICFSCNKERNDEQAENHTGTSEREVVEGEEWNINQIEEFMREAAMIDKMQIRVGKMAQEKAVNESIKIYGKTLVDDHSYSLNKLKELAQIQQVIISDTLDQKHLEKVRELQSFSGNAFERNFLRMMIEGHMKDIEKYRNAQENISSDHTIKEWIDDTLPALHRHLQKAQQLQHAQHEDEL